ncbi:MAG: InlB B-repeat-containing protein, partial [Bacteroidota bacterium]
MKNTFIYLTAFLLLSLGCKKEVLYTLNVTVTPSGSGTTSVTSGTYQAGQTVSITATPSPEYIFKDWSGSVNSTNNPLSLMMDSTKSIIANFEKRQYPLSLTIEGSGVVKEEIVLTQAMVGSYPSGTTVKLTAVPDSGSVFDSWSGDTSLSINPITLKISKPYSIIAKFVEKIKFATNLDTGIYNVSDTLPLKISITSKLPPTGVLVSITSTWTDSSKQIFKLDTTITQSNVNLNIPGHKKTGNYSLFISTTSKSTATNTSNKIIKFINDPLGRFTGYKVDLNAKQLGRSYWENIPYPADLFCSVFQKSTLQSQEVQTVATSWGDFNSDGYMDIFNAGGSYDGIIRGSASFIIWNKEKKIFEETNLFNDKSIKIIGGNAHTVIPKYFNNDDYLDLLIIDNGDEGQLIPGKDEPIKIVLSDGKGGYDVKEIETCDNDNFYKVTNSRKS